MIVEGVEEDLCSMSDTSIDLDEQAERDSIDTRSQASTKQFERNLNNLELSRQHSMKQRKSISTNTANAYVWIKERRTTFTGLTF